MWDPRANSPQPRTQTPYPGNPHPANPYYPITTTTYYYPCMCVGTRDMVGGDGPPPARPLLGLRAR